MARSALKILSVALILASAACATAGTDGDANDDAPSPVVVQVQNNARADVDVSVLVAGQEVRLGRAQVGETGRFRIPATLLRSPPYAFSIRLVARDGTGSYYTPQLTVLEGQGVRIEASPTLGSSRYTVR